MTTTSASSPNVAPVALEGATPRAAGLSSDGGSLECPARRLAEVAHALRVEADHPEELPDLAGVFTDIEYALGDLAVAAEQSAYAVIDNDRPPGARATQVSPTPRARAVSWRLHAVASALRASREVCSAVPSASRELARVQHPQRDGAPGGAHLHHQLPAAST
jgi:hypothetical protein